MKFATLALIGSVSAKPKKDLDHELEEMIKVLYPWEAVEEYWRQSKNIYRTIAKNQDKFDRAERKMEKKIDRWVENNGEKYVPEFWGWLLSDEVAAKERYEREVIMQSPEMQIIFDESEDVWEQLQEMRWGKKATKKGWLEWANNEDLKDLFEEVYDVKEAFVKLVQNKRMMEENERLGMTALAEPHFQRMWEYLQADLHVQGLDGLAKKLCKVLKKMKQRANECPVHQKLKKQIIKLLKTIESTRKVWDLPTIDDDNLMELDAVTVQAEEAGSDSDSDWEGACIRQDGTPQQYFVLDGQRRFIADPAAKMNIWNSMDCQVVGADIIYRFPQGNTMTAQNSYLMRANGDPNVYLVVDGQKRHVANPETMAAAGFNWGRVRIVDPSHGYAIPTGGQIDLSDD